MRKVYPVIFTKTEKGYLVEVPDMNILTEGAELSDAICMARDAIGISGISMEDSGEVIPDASKVSDIIPEKGTFAGEGESFVSLVDIDFAEYRRRNDNKVVRRNVTLPNWLNVEAEKAHINVSRILQEALMKTLDVKPK